MIAHPRASARAGRFASAPRAALLMASAISTGSWRSTSSVVALNARLVWRWPPPS